MLEMVIVYWLVDPGIIVDEATVLSKVRLARLVTVTVSYAVARLVLFVAEAVTVLVNVPNVLVERTFNCRVCTALLLTTPRFQVMTPPLALAGVGVALT